MSELSALAVPGPTITSLSAPFWNAASEGNLLLQHCTVCDRTVFYPRPICPLCWADALEWRDASGKGRLKSFSFIYKPGHPGWSAVAPYTVGLVHLVEGPTMLSYILGHSQAFAVGETVKFAPTNIGGRVLPCFTKI